MQRNTANRKNRLPSNANIAKRENNILVHGHLRETCAISKQSM